MFSLLREYFRITLVATEAGPVVGNGGPASFAELGFDDAGSFDILLVPGGMGTRASVTDARLIAWLGGAAAQAEYVLTVCTGSALLAKTGFLDRQKATTSVSVRCAPPNGADFDGLVSTIDSGHLGAL